MTKNQRPVFGRRFHPRFTNGTWVVLDRFTYNHRPFSLYKLVEEEAELMNARGLPW